MSLSTIDRVIVVVADGVGAGQVDLNSNVDYPEDVGANSIVGAAKVQPLESPGLLELGLPFIPGLEAVQHRVLMNRLKIVGVSGALRPDHVANGSPDGHCALMGLRVMEPSVFFHETGFPDDLVAGINRVARECLEKQVRMVRYPGTDNISGTEFIDHPSVGNEIFNSVGQEELVIGIYTSTDSVLQVAFHTSQMTYETSKELAHAIRNEVCTGPYARVGRIIMRPFEGTPGNFSRVEHQRYDESLSPDGPTVVSHLAEEGIEVHGLGKFAEMFNGVGFDPSRVTKGADDDDRMALTEAWIRDERIKRGVLLANLKNTDERWGHRRNPRAYADELDLIGGHVRRCRRAMRSGDLLVITSDHGNDPTHRFLLTKPSQPHTNHTRENAPVLVAAPDMVRHVQLGIRTSMRDVGATMAEIFNLTKFSGGGTSFLREIRDAM